jgi:hypothetical protein
MPFVTNPEVENGDEVMLSILIDDVDREKDRLMLVFTKDGDVGELAFNLVTGTSGENRLMLDRENCNGYAVTDLESVLDVVAPLKTPGNDIVYVATQEFSTSMLTLELPPSMVMPLIDERNILDIGVDIVGTATVTLRLDDGETVAVESRTLD